MQLTFRASLPNQNKINSELMQCLSCVVSAESASISFISLNLPSMDMSDIGTQNCIIVRLWLDFSLFCDMNHWFLMYMPTVWPTFDKLISRFWICTEEAIRQGENTRLLQTCIICFLVHVVTLVPVIKANVQSSDGSDIWLRQRSVWLSQCKR